MAKYKDMEPNIRYAKINGVTYDNPKYNHNYRSGSDLIIEGLSEALFSFFSFLSKEGLSGLLSVLGKLLLYSFYFIVFNISIGIIFLIAALAFHYFV